MRQQDQNKCRLDGRARAETVNRGDKVLFLEPIKNTFHPKYRSGYTVTNIKGPVVYLQDEGGRERITNLDRVKKSPEKIRNPPGTPPGTPPELHR